MLKMVRIGARLTEKVHMLGEGSEIVYKYKHFDISDYCNRLKITYEKQE